MKIDANLSTKSDVVVLLSGGIDSTACLCFYRQQKQKVTAAFIDYGQAAAKNERKAAGLVAKHYGIDLKEYVFLNYTPPIEGYIPARNMFLLMSALMTWSQKSGLIAIGIHCGTAYLDCSPSFMSAATRVFDFYTNGLIMPVAPFLKYSKGNIFDYCRKENVPLQYTYSCEMGLTQPCGRCASCQDLEKLYAGKNTRS